MATVINNPPGQPTNTSDDSSGMGMLVGIVIVVLILAAFFLLFGMPYLRGNRQMPAEQPIQQDTDTGSETNIEAPDLNVPRDIEVDVNRDDTTP
jgi:hypothetical protein